MILGYNAGNKEFEHTKCYVVVAAAVLIITRTTFSARKFVLFSIFPCAILLN